MTKYLKWIIGHLVGKVGTRICWINQQIKNGQSTSNWFKNNSRAISNDFIKTDEIILHVIHSICIFLHIPTLTNQMPGIFLKYVLNFIMTKSIFKLAATTYLHHMKCETLFSPAFTYTTYICIESYTYSP